MSVLFAMHVASAPWRCLQREWVLRTKPSLSGRYSFWKIAPAIRSARCMTIYLPLSWNLLPADQSPPCGCRDLGRIPQHYQDDRWHLCFLQILVRSRKNDTPEAVKVMETDALRLEVEV
ncbi:hypothetical protein I7I50_01518 [Histoplasma capsulatum G186AR]|uniref:Uncharacterized protein n=1 Tax=Ajellomyces capsulatus TaxID=5037 RepID=A0A8H7YDB5_AJECA|nr:hypothetical protein I7I52_12634 [Histoplasma capsulatum]QSS73377.1 hypothetical protein I7I50_01518 [Histoplasma capsulatum G186AR]